MLIDKHETMATPKFQATLRVNNVEIVSVEYSAAASPLIAALKRAVFELNYDEASFNTNEPNAQCFVISSCKEEDKATLPPVPPHKGKVGRPSKTTEETAGYAVVKACYEAGRSLAEAARTFAADDAPMKLSRFTVSRIYKQLKDGPDAI